MQATLLYCAGLVDGTGRAPLRNAAVRIEDGRITAVGAIDALRTAVGWETIEHDFRPHWIAPGLIDEHTHFSLAGDGRS
ncbi:MAG TPA: hypothetical protein VGL99_06930 [Chloroflexota bacterium]|jgi:N-acyl-D-aspartate/D-glutamate deacylase